MDKFTEFQIYLIASYLEEIVSNKFGHSISSDCFYRANDRFEEKRFITDDDCEDV